MPYQPKAKEREDRADEENNGILFPESGISSFIKRFSMM
jgi:hypothetical protein